MKFSKVKNVRNAIVKSKDGRIEGTFYKIPTRIVGINNNIKKLNQDRCRLYNIFTPVLESSEPKKPDEENYENIEKYKVAYQRYETKKANYDILKNNKELYKEINQEIKNIIFYNKDEIKNNDRNIIRAIKNSDKKIEKNKIKGFVELQLRKSLRKDKSGAIALISNLGNKKISAEDEKAILSLVTTIRNDYYMLYDEKGHITIKGNNIIRSFKNQNLVAQIDNDKKFTIPIPNKKGKKTEHKSNEKQGIIDFISEYADLDTANRKNLLRKLRRIVDVYFNTPSGWSIDKETILPEQVDKSNDFNVWEKHDKAKLGEGNFVELPEKLAHYEKGDVLGKLESKEAMAELEKRIRDRNMNCYRFAIKITDDDQEGLFFDNKNINKYWIHHIENAVEKNFKHRLLYTYSFKIKKAYLSEKIWKDIINSISIKYIAIGKAVFNYGMKDLNKENCDVKFGKIDIDGISSFDYEIIKARETLQREVAVSVAFAASNLSRATVDVAKAGNKNEDFLLWDKDITDKYRKYNSEENTIKACLQFFGGLSKWNIDLFREVTSEERFGLETLMSLKRCVYGLRNDTFHFATNNKDSSWNTKLIGNMFEHEAKRCVEEVKDRFYSNNLPMFYGEKDLKDTLIKLYSKNISRQSQALSFNSVIVRSNFSGFLKSELKLNVSMDKNDTLKFENACYYLFREIYYNDFLLSDKIKDLFFDAIKDVKNEPENEAAIKSFEERCKSIRNYSFAEICQTLMTDYNLQNNNRKKRSAFSSPLDREKYQHYKVILKQCICKSFAVYLNENYNFIKNPHQKSMPVKDEFIPDWNGSNSLYDDLIDKVREDVELQKWYVIGRLLNGKMLSLLVGSMRSYIQYISDIKRRSNILEQRLITDEKSQVKRIKKAIPIIEICIKLSSQYTYEWSDYFTSEDEHAEFLSKYVDFISDNQYKISKAVMLKDFCNNGEAKNDIYMDGKNPKINRNFIQAKLYGPSSIIEKIISDNKYKITSDQIVDFYVLEKDIAKYKTIDETIDETGQKNIIRYQRLKNHIELRNIAEYGEVINDLLGQLINWAYLRERDLMYYQLGFHYVCLNNNKQKPDPYKLIKTQNGNVIEGAILYQIVAFYVNGIDMYALNDKGDYEKKTGGVYRLFTQYGQSIVEEDLYVVGLEIFENINEHNRMINLRNSIDHFKYYAGSMNIMKMYSEIFDSFFSYDMKYRKNVVNMLNNILLRHNVIIETEFGTGIKEMDNGTKKNCAEIKVKSIKSDMFTYKLDAGKELKIAAKDDTYLKNILALLNYPKHTDENIVITYKDKVIKKAEHNNKNESNKSKKNFGKKDNEYVYSDKSSGYFPFKNIRLN